MKFKIWMIPFAITGGIIFLLVSPWLLLGIGLLLSPAPPAPLNTYGEFPFHLVYEVEGKQFTIDDVLVCEYIGRDSNEARGKYLKWDIRLLSGNELDKCYNFHAYEWKDNAVVKLLDDVPVRDYRGRILFDIGNPQYYLGYNVLDGYSLGKVYNSDGNFIEDDILWNQYKIKIIEANLSQPLTGNGIKIDRY